MSNTTFATTTSNPPTTTNVIVGGPTCDPNSIKGSLSAPQYILDQGPTCYWNWPDRGVNFTGCCAHGAEIGYTDVCAQYCLVPDNYTISGFGRCIWDKQPNATVKSIIQCQKKGEAGKLSQPSWKLTVALSGLVASLLLIGS